LNLTLAKVELNTTAMRTIFYCILFCSVLLLSCTRHTGPDWQIPPPPFLQLATLTTSSIADVTNNSATCGGDITNEGGTPVTSRGICWSSSPNPTVALSTKTSNGSGTGAFTSSLTGLTTGVTYYVRAYATNTLGTAYGNEVGFVATTQPTLATLTTTNAVGITTSSASCGGEITSEGNVAVTGRGICWGMNANPTKADNVINIGNGPGIFTASVTGLTAATTYHVRAWATNSVGTAYGNDISFTTYNITPPPPSTVTICSQVWMTKNLDVTAYRNGDPIPQVTDPTQWQNLTTGVWTYVNGDVSTDGHYGKIYNWYAVNDPRGLAPLGYHIPSFAEYTTLANCLGTEYIAGGKLKTSGTTDWMSPNTGATNSSGFSALPGGRRSNAGTFSGFGTQGLLWTATSQSATHAWTYYLVYSSAGSSFVSTDNKEGATVRCVKD
jgi:uncharacterized protein (TIGR02145 family)